uniref:BCL9 like n=1 Tax=Sphenodon punctatus TaxID=8508 RepID=A0A8D0GI23_SPHPU
MHPDNKLTNHGKTGNSSAQSQHHNVSQGPTCNLGSKGVGAGNHGGKANQISPGNSGLKTSQNTVPNFGSLKGKVKRERSISVDSGEQREASTPSLDTELKGEAAPRSKRRCVLERKQPYSGDEWCSGPDSEEDDKPLGNNVHHCNVADPAMSAASQLGSESSASSAPHGAAPGLRSDAGGGSGKQPSQFVYVFTTHLANTAAEAVLQGRADSILAYHQQNVPRAKLDQVPAPKVPGVLEPLPINPPPPASTPQSQTAAPLSSQTQPQPPAPPPPSLGQGTIPTASALPQEGGPEDARRELTPTSVGNSSGSAAPGGTHPSTPTGPSTLPGGPSDALLGEGASTGPPRNPLNAEGLSKEQLEHRERSLQTLRDIERLLLRSSEAEPFLKGGQGPIEGGAPPPPQPPQAPAPGVKKYEEPLQSMISQTQSLGGPSLEPEGPPHPGAEMGQQMNLMMQRLGQDSLTPEQVAWRKLQEEYYEEKRRKEEQIGLHGHRPMQEMLLPPQPIASMLLRGPPPPYHSKPGEQWPPGMGGQLRGPMDVQDLRSGPRFPGNQMQRVSGFGGMASVPMESLGPINAMQRPVRPGLGWSEELPLGGPGSFAQGALPYPPGQGETERFLAPRTREEMLRQQLLEKRPGGMQRPMGSMEMERMMQAHRQLDPAMFAGEGLGLEFAGSRGCMLSPPLGQAGLRELEPPLNMNMNVNMNMNMNLNLQMTPQQQQMLMSQKMRGPEMLTPEELARARAQAQNGAGAGAMMGVPPQKMLMSSQFSSQGQQAFAGGQGPYPNIPPEMGSAPDMFSPEPLGSIGSTRLSHIPLPPAAANAPPARGLGRRPSDLTINIGQMNSPGMGHLKSPTLSQVHSPLGTSPSANLKSPQTPSAMVNLPPANAASAPLKSPQVLGPTLSVRSPASSPSRLKSPSMTVPSPGWAPSPKTALPSPGISQSKPALNMTNSAPMGSLEQDPAPSQNPLSLMMSQMSKYAMPSSTPLYHNAIKTIATSDDEMLPDRPMLPPGAMPGMGGNQPNQLHMNSVGPASAQSPMGMNLAGQQPLSHEPPAPLMSSPSPLGPSIPMHGSGPPPNPMMLPHGPQDSMSQPCGPGQLVFPPRMQQPPGPMQSPAGASGGMPGAGGAGVQQHYPPGMPLPPEEPSPMPPQQRMAGRMAEPYPSVLPGVASVLNDPELSEVIRPTPTGIPEFDLSRIIPSEKPSSTLQYFPKSESQAPKPQPPSNLHLMNLQNMMAEQAPVRPSQQPVHRGGLGMPLCHPGQVPMLGRTGMAPQQAVMGNSMHQGMMSAQQSLLAQQNFMLMQAKQRSMSVSGGEMYPQPGHMMSPQAALMGPPGPQQNLMVAHQLRQRSVSLDGQMNYNLPF